MRILPVPRQSTPPHPAGRAERPGSWCAQAASHWSRRSADPRSRRIGVCRRVWGRHGSRHANRPLARLHPGWTRDRSHTHRLLAGGAGRQAHRRRDQGADENGLRQKRVRQVNQQFAAVPFWFESWALGKHDGDQALASTYCVYDSTGTWSRATRCRPDRRRRSATRSWARWPPRTSRSTQVPTRTNSSWKTSSGFSGANRGAPASGRRSSTGSAPCSTTTAASSLRTDGTSFRPTVPSPKPSSPRSSRDRLPPTASPARRQRVLEPPGRRAHRAPAGRATHRLPAGVLQRRQLPPVPAGDHAGLGQPDDGLQCEDLPARVRPAAHRTHGVAVQHQVGHRQDGGPARRRPGLRRPQRAGAAARPASSTDIARQTMVQQCGTLPSFMDEMEDVEARDLAALVSSVGNGASRRRLNGRRCSWKAASARACQPDDVQQVHTARSSRPTATGPLPPSCACWRSTARTCSPCRSGRSTDEVRARSALQKCAGAVRNTPAHGDVQHRSGEAQPARPGHGAQGATGARRQAGRAHPVAGAGGRCWRCARSCAP